jgi:hypothetical protein
LRPKAPLAGETESARWDKIKDVARQSRETMRKTWKTARPPADRSRELAFYLTDRRYTVPTLSFAVVRDEDEARRLAVDLLSGPDHLKVEVWEGDRLSFTVEPPDLNEADPSHS